MAKLTGWIAAAAAIVGLGSTAGGAGLQFNDPQAPFQWYLGQLRFNEAWAAVDALPTRGDITVAVIDSGFQSSHVDLSANLVAGINIVDGTNNIEPVHPHGTATAGLPGGISNNSVGISQSALFSSVMPIRVSNRSDGAAFISDIADGIRYAADHGARVINISYSGVDHPALEAAGAYAWSKGAVVIMSAGNDGMKHNNWANHPHLIAVGASTATGTLASFSTRGRFVDLVAPGQSITTLFTGNQYAQWSGTSFSSPLVASVAALMLTANPDLSPDQVDDLLRSTATNPAQWMINRKAWARQNLKAAKQQDQARRVVKLKRQVRRLNRRIQNVEEAWGAGRVDALAAVEAALATQGLWSGLGTDVPWPLSDDWSRWSRQGLGDVLALPQGFLDVVPQQVPEPATLALAAAGLALMTRGRSPTRRSRR